MLHDNTVAGILARAEEDLRFAFLCGYCPNDLLKGELIFKDTIGELATNLLEAAIHGNESALTTFLGLLKHRHEVIRGVVYRAVLDRMLDIRHSTFNRAHTALLNALSQAEQRPENVSFVPWWTATNMLHHGFW